MSGLKQSYSYPMCQTLATDEIIQKDQNNNTIPNSLQDTSLFKEDITKTLYKKNPLVSFMDTASSKTPITQKLVDFIDLDELKDKNKTEKNSILDDDDVIICTDSSEEEIDKIPDEKEEIPKQRIEIDLCESSSENEDINYNVEIKPKKVKKKKLKSPPKLRAVLPSEINRHKKEDPTTLLTINDFIEDELDKNINSNLMPNTDTLEAVLNHFNDESMCPIKLAEENTNEPNMPKTKLDNQAKVLKEEKTFSNFKSEKNDIYIYFNDKLREVFQKRIDKLGVDHPISKQFNKSALNALVININEQVLKNTNPYGDSPKKYFNKMVKIKKIIDPEPFNQNSTFYMKILSGKLKPEELAKMSDEVLLYEHENEIEKLNINDIISNVGSNVEMDTSNDIDSDEEMPLSAMSKKYLNKYEFVFILM